MTIGQRIKSIRENLNLSQTAFGTKIGVTRDSINNIERDRNKKGVPENIIKIISVTFNVNYDWLVNGIGEPFNPTDDISNRLNQIINGDNETAKAIFRAFAKLTDDEWAAVGSVVDKLLRELK